MKLALIFAACGFLATFLAIPFLISLSKKGFGVDRADPHRKTHEGQISRVGGLPIFGVFLLAMIGMRIWGVDESRFQFWPIVVCGTLFFGLGFWDDLRPLGARVKLAGQLAIALLAYGMGLRIDLFTYPLGAFSFELGAWSIPATVFWLIAIPNIINLIDGFDGLAAGLGVFLALTLGSIAYASGQMATAWLSFVLAGSLAGFLFYNFPPAKIFLGDGGAYLIGFCIAAFSLQSANKGSIAAALMVTTVALGLPILDTSLALLRRAIRGVPLFRGDREHIHHRLEGFGFSKRRILLAMYAVCVTLNLAGLSVFWSHGRTIPIAAAAVFLLAVFAVRYLGYVSHFRSIQQQLELSLGRRSEMQYAVLQGQLMELEVYRCSDARQFWERFIDALERSGLERASEQEPETPSLLSRNEEGEIKLRVAGRGANRDYWQRVADCFQPAFALGVKKWPEIRPDQSA